MSTDEPSPTSRAALQARAGSTILDPLSVEPSEEAALDVSRELEPGHAPPADAGSGARGAGVGEGGSAAGIKSGRLAGLSMGQAIKVMSVPVLCESVLNSLIGLVDTSVASHISEGATDAVGGAAYLLWFMGLVTMAIGVGATGLISRAMGAGKQAVARAALGQAMLLAVIGGVLLAVTMWTIAPFMAGVMSMHGAAERDFVVYIRALCVGMPATTVMFAAIACARGAGDTLRPLRTMLYVNIINFLLCWLLAVQLGWGVLGIGLGTSIAQILGAALIVNFHRLGASGVRLRGMWLRPHRVTAYRLVRLGLPNFIETFGMWVVNFGTVLMVGWMGAAAMARANHASDAAGYMGAHLLAIRIEAFSFLPGFSMGIAASALCGQYLGAGLPHMARRAALRCAYIAAGIMGVCGLGLIFLGQVIVDALSSQPVHHEIVPQLLLITGFTQVPFAFAIVFRSSMQGAGDVRAVAVMSWITQWGLRLPLCYVFSGVDIPLPSWLGGAGGQVIVNPFPFRWGLPGLWIGLCTEIALRCVIYGWRFRSGKWTRARV